MGGAGACRRREIGEHSDLVVVWGGNPVNTQVNVMTHIARARKERGAKLVVVDPYRTGTAEQADMHLALRPGTDGALACAVMHVLFAEGFADRDYLRRYTRRARTSWSAHLRHAHARHGRRRSPAYRRGDRRFARLYGAHQAQLPPLGYGFTRSRNGAAAMHAVSCLPAVTGAWQHQGGGALYNMRRPLPTSTRR